MVWENSIEYGTPYILRIDVEVGGQLLISAHEILDDEAFQPSPALPFDGADNEAIESISRHERAP